jgi:hypothetical protein
MTNDCSAAWIARMAASAVLCLVAGGRLCAQDPATAPPTTPPAGTLAPPSSLIAQTDTFPLIREAADAKRTIYEQTDARNMAEIDRLKRSKVCQTNRIGPLLDDNLAAMQDYVAAEREYWKLWGETEQKRVDSQMDVLARMEGDKTRVAEQLASENADHKELAKHKSELEQAKRTEAIAAQMDALIKDIQDSEARLTDAQQLFESLTVQVKNMRASIATRLVGIRQNSARLEAWQLDMAAYYEKVRADANEICNVMTPVTGNTLPKKGGHR